jgi:hypothetical protein
MKNAILLFSVLMMFGANRLFSQDALLQDFKSELFEFKYPKKWKVDTTDNRYSFYFNAKLGDISISTYADQHFSSTELRQMLLDLNEIKETKPDIQLTTSGSTTTCVYEYTSDKVKYLVKAIQKDRKLYLISLNWNEDSWDTFKGVLLASFESFRAK